MWSGSSKTIATGEIASDTVSVVLAGGRGSRLGRLTRDICKPALPFGAGYRNIDFTLSNCLNSGIGRVCVATQYKPDILHRHIASVWLPAVGGSDRSIAVWPAEERAANGYSGTADAVYRNMGDLMDSGKRLVLVLAGDHIYQMDYRPFLQYHCEHGADVTVGSVEVDATDACQFGILTTDRDGRITRFVEKPRHTCSLPDPAHVQASMGIYVFELRFLADVLRRDARSANSTHDFGRDILPMLVNETRSLSYRFAAREGDGPAYWRDVGTPGSYWRAQLDLLDDSPALRLDDSHWPLPPVRHLPKISAQFASSTGTERLARSLLTSNCVIRGTVDRSVIFPDVYIGVGASIEDSVILPGTSVGRNCRLRGVIVDTNCAIPDATIIEPRICIDARAAPVVVTAEDFPANLPGSQVSSRNPSMLHKNV